MVLVGVGPFGGKGGVPFDYDNTIAIKKIIIYSSDYVDSICFEYDHEDGTTSWSKKLGGDGGSKHEEVVFDYPDEYLKQIDGCYKSFSDDSLIIKSLTFFTNKAMYGPYGTDDSISTFTIPTKDSEIVGFFGASEIVGFFGASGKYLDKIGVYLKPRDEPESRSA